MLNRTLATLAILTSLAAASACTRNAEEVPLEGGELIFSDDFEAAEIDAASWSAEGDTWRIDDGVLRGAGAENDALWLGTELPSSVRIEFKARAFSSEGDLKFEVFGDGTNHGSGYIGIFGGWGNRLNIIARLDEHGDDRKVGAEGQRVVANSWYDFAIVRDGSTLHWFVNGEPFMTYRDAAALKGDGHRHFAFNNWEAPVGFDDIRIYDLEADNE